MPTIDSLPTALQAGGAAGLTLTDVFPVTQLNTGGSKTTRKASLSTLMAFIASTGVAGYAQLNGAAFTGNVTIGSAVTTLPGGTLTAGTGITATRAGGGLLQSYDSTAVTDKKFWRIYNLAGDFVFEKVNDAYTAAAELLRITNAGNVGIGIAAPALPLDVLGSIRSGNGSSNGAVVLTPGGTTSTGYTAYYNAAGTRQAYSGNAVTGGVTVMWADVADALLFGSNGTEIARFDSAGNFSIGSTGSDYGTTWRILGRKDQNGATTMGLINASATAGATCQFEMITATANSFLGIILADLSGSPICQIHAGSGVTAMYYDCSLHVWRNTAGTERLRIDGTGNLVGVGKASFTAVATAYGSSTPTTGTTVAIGAAVGRQQVLGTTTLATLTVQLPATPIDGQECHVCASPAITALTVQDSAGGTTAIIAPPAGLAAGAGFSAIWSAGASQWWCCAGT